MTKILFISHYFPPAGGAGVQRAEKFVRYLPCEGFLPSVIAGPASIKDPWDPKDPTLTALIPSELSVYHVEGCPPDSAKSYRRVPGGLRYLSLL